MCLTESDAREQQSNSRDDNDMLTRIKKLRFRAMSRCTIIDISLERKADSEVIKNTRCIFKWSADSCQNSEKLSVMFIWEHTEVDGRSRTLWRSIQECEFRLWAEWLFCWCSPNVESLFNGKIQPKCISRWNTLSKQIIRVLEVDPSHRH